MKSAKLISLWVLSFLSAIEFTNTARTRSVLGCNISHASCRNLKGFLFILKRLSLFISYTYKTLIKMNGLEKFLFNLLNSRDQEIHEKCVTSDSFLMISLYLTRTPQEVSIYLRKFIAIKLSPVKWTMCLLSNAHYGWLYHEKKQ